jgi:oxygen-dependent protoporphyrinogen oxidase
VVGGGIAGLAAGYRLQQLGVPLLVLEASPRPGGTVQHQAIETETGTWHLEVGPNTVRESPELKQLATELGLAQEWVPPAGAHRRWVVRGGKLRQVPTGPSGLVSSRLLTLREKLFALREGKRPLPDLQQPFSVYDLMAQRFGPAVADWLVEPFVAGIWAGDARALNAEYAFPQVWQALQQQGSVLRGFRQASRERRQRGEAPMSIGSFRSGGLQRFTDTLAQALGASLRLKAPVQHLEHLAGQAWRVQLASGESFDTPCVVSTVGSHATLSWLAHSPLQPLLEPLRQQPHPPVAMLHLGFRREAIAHRLNGFGFLVPRAEPGLRILGAVFPSELFPGRAPAGHVLVTVFIGGERHPKDAALAPDDLVALAVRDLNQLLGVKQPPVFQHVARWPEAIPQYDAGHRLRVQALEKAQAEYPTLVLAGNYWGGVGVPDRLRAGLAAAERAAKSRILVP